VGFLLWGNNCVFFNLFLEKKEKKGGGGGA